MLINELSSPSNQPKSYTPAQTRPPHQVSPSSSQSDSDPSPPPTTATTTDLDHAGSELYHTNLSALHTLVDEQTLHIKYPFYSVKMPTCAQVIVFSGESHASAFADSAYLVPISCTNERAQAQVSDGGVQVVPMDEDAEEARDMSLPSLPAHVVSPRSTALSADQWQQIRTYICHCRLRGHLPMHPDTIALVSTSLNYCLIRTIHSLYYVLLTTVLMCIYRLNMTLPR